MKSNGYTLRLVAIFSFRPCFPSRVTVMDALNAASASAWHFCSWRRETRMELRSRSPEHEKTARIAGVGGPMSFRVELDRPHYARPDALPIDKSPPQRRFRCSQGRGALDGGVRPHALPVRHQSAAQCHGAFFSWTAKLLNVYLWVIRLAYP